MATGCKHPAALRAARDAGAFAADPPPRPGPRFPDGTPDDDPEPDPDYDPFEDPDVCPPEPAPARAGEMPLCFAGCGSGGPDVPF